MVGLRFYERILTDADVWHGMQVTAHFVVWTIVHRDACSASRLPI